MQRPRGKQNQNTQEFASIKWEPVAMRKAFSTFLQRFITRMENRSRICRSVTPSLHAASKDGDVNTLILCEKRAFQLGFKIFIVAIAFQEAKGNFLILIKIIVIIFAQSFNLDTFFLSAPTILFQWKEHYQCSS